MPPNRVESKEKPLPKKSTGKLFDLRNWNSQHVKLLLILTLIGTYARIEPALFDSVHFSYDQGVDLFYVRQLVEDKKISLIGRFTGLEGVFLGPLWTWFLAVPYLASGGSPTANQLFLSLFGIAWIWLTYAIVRRMLSETAGIMAAVYAAISPTFLAASHIVLSPYPLVLLMLLYIWFLWEIVENKREQFWPWLGLLAGIFFQLEIGFAIFMLPTTLIVIALFGKLRGELNKPRLIGAGLFLATFLPQIVFELRHDFLMSRAILRFIGGENLSLGSEGVGVETRFLIRLGSLWEDYSTAVAFKGKDTLATFLVTFPAISGWVKAIKIRDNKSLRLGLITTTIIVGMYVGFTVYPGPVWVWYRAGLPITFILLVVIGWTEFMRKNRLWKWSAILLFITLGVISLGPLEMIARLVSPEAGGVSTLKNQKQALNVIFQDSKNQPFDLYIYTPPVYTYVWDHLLSWYAKANYENFPVDYGYQRSESAESDFYLLIEPDDIQGRVDGWKGNFEGEGIPQNTWHLPGAITVEKWKSQNQQTNESNQ